MEENSEHVFPALIDKNTCILDTRGTEKSFGVKTRQVCFLIQVMIYHRLRIGRDGHLDQSEAYDT